MCKRFALDLDWDAIAAQFSVAEEDVRGDVLPRPSYNIAPTQNIAVIAQGKDGHRHLTGAYWSLIPSWSPGKTLPYPTYNARVESAHVKSTFAESTRSRRTIIPASGYYEWKGRRPFYFSPEMESTALAMAGLSFLCMTGGSFGFAMGDLIGLSCALLFSIHITVIDHFSPMVDGVKMSCIQFFFCAILSGIGMLIFEQPSFANILAAWKPILYAGAMSSGVGYTLQIVGQKGMNPAVASLIMSLESVISVIAGWLILGQALSGREIFGCVLMFGAIVLAQLPERKRKEATDAYSVYEEIIKDNIEYDYLIQDRYLDRDRIEEILALILETVCTKRRTIRIAGDDHPAELVKAKFMKLNSEHIRFVLDCMQENTTKIRNIKQYMKAALFNAPSTIGSYYTSLVSHDMYGGRTIQSARSKGIPDYTCNEGESL